jgi:hypothetical protein
LKKTNEREVEGIKERGRKLVHRTTKLKKEADEGQN